MTKSRNLLLVIPLVMLSLAACEPGRIAKVERPKEGPPEYLKGWDDGCESGLGTSYTNDWYKTFHSYTKDKRMINNRLYSVGWKDGYHYCRHYSGQWVRWGYFDDYDSLRNTNPGERAGFEVPGWNGKDYDYTLKGVYGNANTGSGGIYGANGTQADTLFGWGGQGGSSQADGLFGWNNQETFLFGW